MGTIGLTTSQRKALMEVVESWRYVNNNIRFEIEFEDMTIDGEGWVSTDGYTEDDTGSYVETYREASLELKVTRYYNNGERCEEVYLDPDIESECLEILNRTD